MGKFSLSSLSISTSSYTDENGKFPKHTKTFLIHNLVNEKNALSLNETFVICYGKLELICRT